MDLMGNIFRNKQPESVKGGSKVTPAAANPVSTETAVKDGMFMFKCPVCSNVVSVSLKEIDPFAGVNMLCSRCKNLSHVPGGYISEQQPRIENHRQLRFDIRIYRLDSPHPVIESQIQNGHSDFLYVTGSGFLRHLLSPVFSGGTELSADFQQGGRTGIQRQEFSGGAGYGGAEGRSLLPLQEPRPSHYRHRDSRLCARLDSKQAQVIIPRVLWFGKQQKGESQVPLPFDVHQFPEDAVTGMSVCKCPSGPVCPRRSCGLLYSFPLSWRPAFSSLP